MGEITELLSRSAKGDAAAMSAVFRHVYPELRRLASSQLGQRDQTLTPTVPGNPDVAETSATLGMHALDGGDTARARSDLAAARAVFGDRPPRPRTARQMEALERALDASDQRLQPIAEDPPRR